MGTETAQKGPTTGKEGGQPKIEAKGTGTPDAAKEKKFAGAKALASRLRGMLHRNNNPEDALKKLPDLRESEDAKKISRTSEAWKKATTRGLLRRGLNAESAAWQKDSAHKDDVDSRYKELLADKTDLKPKDRFRYRAQAISESMQNEGVDPSAKSEKKANSQTDKGEGPQKLTRREIKNSDAYKTEVNQRLDIMTSEKGRTLGKLETLRVKRDVLHETLDKDRNARELTARNEAATKAEQQKQAAAEVLRRENARKHADYSKTYAEELRKLNPTGRKMEPGELTDQSTKAQAAAEARIIKQEDEAIQAEQLAKNIDRADAIRYGDYHDVMAQMLLANPDMVNDPDLDQKVSKAAVAQMNAREAKAKGATASETGDAGGTTAPGAEASTAGEPATPEAPADASADILKTLNIDLETPEGQKKAQELISNMFKQLTGNEMDASKIDLKDPMWKTILAFLGTFAVALLKGAAGAGAEGVLEATGKSS